MGRVFEYYDTDDDEYLQYSETSEAIDEYAYEYEQDLKRKEQRDGKQNERVNVSRLLGD